MLVVKNVVLDELLSLSEAAKRLPQKPSPATLYRWRTKGANGVHLKCVRIGRTWYTTIRWLNDFIVSQSNTPNFPDIQDSEADSIRSAETLDLLAKTGLLGGLGVCAEKGASEC